MNAEKFEQVLKFTKGYADALSSAPNALHDVLECVICNSLLVSPYTLKCGHTFCSNCLASWFKERSHDASCPTCRDRVTSEPVPNLALRQLSLAVLESWNADPEHEQLEIPAAEMGLARGEKLFPGVRVQEPLYDNEDGVYRCPNCDHEIEDGGTCSGCGLHFPELGLNSSDESFRSFDGARYDGRYTRSSSDEMDSADIDFVVDDDDPEVSGGDRPFQYSNSDTNNDDSDAGDIEVTEVRPSRPWTSTRAVVIDDEDSD